MTTAPMLSIVVILPDSGNGLGESLWSVLRQQGVDLEAVLVGSTSRTAIGRRFTGHDPRIRLETLAGPDTAGAAHTAGLAAARGRYVMFLDGGDVLADNAGTLLVDSLEESGADFAGGIVEAFGGTGRAVQAPIAGPAFSTPHRRTSLAELPELVSRDNTWGIAFRRSFLTAAAVQWTQVQAPAVLATVTAHAAATAVDVLDTPVYFRRARPAAARALREVDGLAEWIGQVGEGLDALEAARSAPAVAAFARHALGDDLEQRLPTLAKADSSLAARSARVFRRLADAAGPTHLRHLSPLTRWELAVAILGRQDLLGLVRDPDDRDDPSLDGLDGALPPALQTALGLGDLRVAEAFRMRFLQRRPYPTPPSPVATPVAATEPEISLVIAAHNVAGYLGELMRSLRAVSGVQLEIIVVDDRSTDATWETLQECAALDPRVRAVRSPGRGGGQARNYGVELATAEYLAFADGDDIVPPHAYAAMLEAARRTRAEVVTGSYVKLFTNSTWDPSLRYGYTVELAAVRIADHPQLATHRACWNRLFRRDFWVANALPFPGVPRSNDIVAVTSALTAAERITVIPAITYVYRSRPGGGSMTSGLGLAEPTISYLSEEATCARLIAQVDDPAVTAEYWSMVLDSDGTSHLRPYLAARRANPDAPADEVPRWHAALLDLAPAESVLGLRPEVRALHALVRHGEVAAAATFAAAAIRDDPPPPLGEVLDALAAAAGTPGIDADLLGRLVQRFLVDRLVADPEAATVDLAGRAVALVQSLAAERGVRPPTAPSEPGHRVAAVLLRGTAPDLRSVLAAHKGPKVTLRAGLTTARVVAAGRRGTGRALFISASPAAAPDSARVLLGQVESGTADNSWQAVLHPDAVPAPGRWTLYAELADEWGLRRVPLRIAAAGSRPAMDKLARFASTKRSDSPGTVWIRSAPAERLGQLLAGPAAKARRLFSRAGLRAVRRRLRLG